MKKESEVDSALEEVLEADLMPAYAHKEAYSMEAIAKLKFDFLLIQRAGYYETLLLKSSYHVN